MCIFVVAIIIVILILAIANNNLKQRDNVSEADGEPTLEEMQQLLPQEEKGLRPIKNQSTFYVVKDSIGKYYSYYSVIFNIAEYYGINDESVLTEMENDNVKILYNMLANEYINEENVSESNLKTKIKPINNVTPIISNVYIIQETENINTYLVEGILKGINSNSSIDKFKIIINLDNSNKTFSIFPQEYVEKNYNDLKVGEEISIAVPEKIEINKNNTFESRAVSEENYVKDMFLQFKNMILYDREKAYNWLNQDYKNARFDSIEKFNDYLKNRETRYTSMQLQKYEKKVMDDYVQYTCIDQNDNYYIFREYTVMNYDVILDTHTIDLPEFTAKYEAAEDEDKVVLNLEKIRSAINDKDYEYVYNKLNDEFAKNKFSSYNKFVQFIKTKFSENNTFKYEKIEMQGNNYIVKVTISNDSSQSSSITFVVRLGEGTKFEMSFNVN